MAALARRDNDFSQDATPFEKASVAVDAIALLIGVIELVLVIVAIARAAGHRTPFIVLLFAVLLYTISHGLDIGTFIMSYDENVFEHISTFVSVSISDDLLLRYADILALAATFAVLWNRRASLAFLHPAERLGVLKRVLDLLVLAFMALFGLVRAAVLGGAQVAVYNETIRARDYEKRVHIVFGLGHVYVAFYFLAVVDVVISAFLLRARMSRESARDKPTNIVAFFLVPLWLVHFAYGLFADVWDTHQFDDGESDTTAGIILIVSTIEIALLPALIFLVFIVLGMGRAMWNTFGDQAGKQQLAYGAPQQPQYYYPQQQTAQPYASQPQPGYGQQAQWQQPNVYAQPQYAQAAQSATPPLHPQL